MSLRKNLKKIKRKIYLFAEKNQTNFLWKITRYLENMVKYHSCFRIKNYIEYRILIFSRKFASLNFSADISNGVFRILQNLRDKTVLKIPKFNNQYSDNLWKSIKNHQDFSEYEKFLKSLAERKAIGNHFPRVYSVRRDGGYVSEFIDGVNLYDLRESVKRNKKIPEMINADSLWNAIQILVNNLEIYRNEKNIRGDWAVQNLLFDKKKGRIVNVDLEGIWIYGENRVESDMAFLKGEMESLHNLMIIVEKNWSPNILNAVSLIQLAMDRKISYWKKGFFCGYHSISLGKYRFQGQRDCVARMDSVPMDFRKKVVLDIGCNAGGMLHAVAGIIKMGIGIDSDARWVKAAESVSKVNHQYNIHFYEFDIEKEDLKKITEFFAGSEIDVTLLMSVNMWTEKYEPLINFARENSRYLLYESYGKRDSQYAQRNVLEDKFKNVSLVSEKSDDDFVHKDRKLFLCSND